MTDSIQPRRFFAAWLVAGIGGVPLAMYVSGMASAEATQFAKSILPTELALNFLYHNGYWSLQVVLQLLLFGALIGIVQKNIIRRYLRIELDRWIVMSMLGGAIAGILTIIVVSNLESFVQLISARFSVSGKSLAPLYSLPTVFIILALSSLQAVAIRSRVKAAWIWMVVHASAAVLAYLGVLAVYTASPDSINGGDILSLAVTPIATVLTGIAMVRILLPSLRSGKAKRGVGRFEPTTAEAQPHPSVSAEVSRPASRP